MTKEEILQEFSDINHVYNNCARYDTLRRMLNELTEPKTGQWIRHDNGKYHWYLCSCCDAMAGSDKQMMAYRYCPNCGAKMESEG